MQGAEHEISGKAIVTAQKGFDCLIENPKGAHADKQEKADQSGCDRGKKWTDKGSGKHGKAEDAWQTELTVTKIRGRRFC